MLMSRYHAWPRLAQRGLNPRSRRSDINHKSAGIWHVSQEAIHRPICSADQINRRVELLGIRDFGGTNRRRSGGRRQIRSRGRRIDQNRRRGRRLSVGRGRCVGRRWKARAVVRHRQEHMVGELWLVGATTTDVYAAAFTAGDRCPVGQGHRRVVAVPPDHQGVGCGSILEATLQQGSFLISGVKAAAKNRPVGGCIRNPRSQA